MSHTMAQTLATAVNERQEDWVLQLVLVEFAYKNSVTAPTGLIPNEVHAGRLIRSPLVVFDTLAKLWTISIGPTAIWLQTGSRARTRLFVTIMPLRGY